PSSSSTPTSAWCPTSTTGPSSSTRFWSRCAPTRVAPGDVRPHIFLCMLAYYVEWHLRRSWAPLLFEDEELEQARGERDPVAKAEASEAVDLKKKTRLTESGLEVHSFRTLLAELGSQTRNTCTIVADPTQASFEQVSEATPL